MIIISSYLVAAAVTAFILPQTLASPLQRSTLARRVLVSESQCDDSQDAIMTNPIYGAVILANSTFSNTLPDGTTFRHSTAFSHYFEDSDYPTVNKMFQAINDYTYTREARTPSLWFLCSQPDSVPGACNQKGRLVYADPDSHPYTWNASQFLPRSGFGFCAPFFVPSEPKIQTYVFSKSTEEWCKAESTVGDYYTVGFLMLQSFTETDAYGEIAGLPARPQKNETGIFPRTQTHGTTSIPPDPHSPTPAGTARNLKIAWSAYIAGLGPRPHLKRVQNAPSYAAAATEWYFLTLCGRAKGFEIPIANLNGSSTSTVTKDTVTTSTAVPSSY